MSKPLDRKVRKHKAQRVPKAQASAPVAISGEQPPATITGFMDNDHRHAMIAQHAYHLAEQRGFEPGHELDDWLIAEKDVEHLSDSPASESPRLCGD